MSQSNGFDENRDKEVFKRGTLWLTGLPASGKTTLANILHKQLKECGLASVKLDGDQIRRGLSSDLCSKSYVTVDSGDDENLRRVVEVCKVVAASDVISVCSFVSPYKKWRQSVRQSHQTDRIPFFEVFLDAPLAECIERDIERSRIQGRESLYQKALDGVITDMIEINGPKYERYDSFEEKPELTVALDEMIDGPEETAQFILKKFLEFVKN